MSAYERLMRVLEGRLATSLGRALPAAAMIAALALGAWLAAGWFVYFTTPPIVPAAPARPNITIAAAAETVADAEVFGAAAPTGDIVVSTLNVKLKGVFAGRAGAPGHAIVNTGGSDQTARVGSEISPGIALDSVHPHHIVLKRNGVFERVNLEERPLLAQVAPRPVVSPPASPVPPKPPQAGEQGLVVSSVPAGSLLERIGLQPGDVIKSVNGQPVASEADVARVLQNGSQPGPVNAEVVRGGATVPLAVSAGTMLRP